MRPNGSLSENLPISAYAFFLPTQYLRYHLLPPPPSSRVGLTLTLAQVRAAAVYALGTFLGGCGDSEQRKIIELNLAVTLPVVTADSRYTSFFLTIFSLFLFVFPPSPSLAH